MHSDNRTAVRNNHNVVLIRNLLHIYKIASHFVEYARLDAHTCPALQSVIFKVAALTEAVGSYRKHVLAFVYDKHIDKTVVCAKFHSSYACGVPAH